MRKGLRNMHDYNQVERKKQRTGYLSAVFLEKEHRDRFFLFHVYLCKMFG